jgi:hypothetical protein
MTTKKKLTNKQLAVLAEGNVCSICFIQYDGEGNNAYPINKGRCCNDCNGSVVVTARLNIYYNRKRSV